MAMPSTLCTHSREMQVPLASTRGTPTIFLGWKQDNNILAGEIMYSWGSFYYHGLTSIPAWISNYFHYKVWDKITYPFLNFNGATVEVKEWISNFILHFTGVWLLIHAGIKVKPC